MIKIRDIDHLVLRVVNLPAMLRFYCEGLGCHVERRQDEIGLVRAAGIPFSTRALARANSSSERMPR